jgi:hypothetical protein
MVLTLPKYCAASGALAAAAVWHALYTRRAASHTCRVAHAYSQLCTPTR